LQCFVHGNVKLAKDKPEKLRYIVSLEWKIHDEAKKHDLQMVGFPHLLYVQLLECKPEEQVISE